MGIINTTEKENQREWLLGGNPGAIKNQETRGQQQLCNSIQLPKDGLAENAEKFGIKILGESKNDPLFMDVELPAGWTKKATDHSMWSDLVDENGNKKASIFYKAAFYDRSAFISFPKE